MSDDTETPTEQLQNSLDIVNAHANQLQAALDNSNDRLTVLGESLIASINESVAAKAEIRRLSRLLESLSNKG